MIDAVLFYLGFIWFIAVTITLTDKINAKKRKQRIPESFLILISVIGGAVPMFITMILIRHKTKHPKFMAGLPIIILFQILLTLFLLNR